MRLGEMYDSIKTELRLSLVEETLAEVTEKLTKLELAQSDPVPNNVKGKLCDKIFLRNLLY